MYTITEKKWALSENHKIGLQAVAPEVCNETLYIADFNKLYCYAEHKIITVFVRKEVGADFIELAMEDGAEYEPDLLDVMDDRN